MILLILWGFTIGKDHSHTRRLRIKLTEHQIIMSPFPYQDQTARARDMLLQQSFTKIKSTFKVRPDYF